MDLKRYKDLPDVLEPTVVRSFFEELLTMPKPLGEEQSLEMAMAFLELSDRQWHTYKVLDDSTRQALDCWIISNWDCSSEKMTGYLLGVIGSVGLPKSFEFMKEALQTKIPPFSLAVRTEIERAIDDFGSTVENPYSGMEKTHSQALTS